MVALQIRDVPGSVRDLLAEEAKRRDQSLQVFLLTILEREAGSASNRRWLDRHRSGAVRSRRAVSTQEIVSSIAAARSAHGA
jgi:hypothetical protein